MKSSKKGKTRGPQTRWCCSCNQFGRAQCFCRNICRTGERFGGFCTHAKWCEKKF